MRRVPCATDCFYHVYNRGVDKRDIFLDDGFYARFASILQHYLKYSYPYSILKRRLEKASSPKDQESIFAQIKTYKIAPPVAIISFCLMPNHYHLILKQRVKDGIATFMHRIGTAYTMYFNVHQERTGRLFEGVYKTVSIESEEQLLHLSRYQHLNPRVLDVSTVEGLINYPWSSLATYLGRDRFTFVTPEDVLSAFKRPKDYLDFVLGEVDRYESLRLQEVAVDDDLGWFADFREMAKERRDRLREQYFTAVM